MTVRSSKSALMSRLEQTLDDNEELIGKKVWEELEDTFDSLDDEADQLERDLDEAQERIKELEERVEELERDGNDS